MVRLQLRQSWFSLKQCIELNSTMVRLQLILPVPLCLLTPELNSTMVRLQLGDTD